MWQSTRKWKDHLEATRAQQLVRECECFLTGRYASVMHSQGLPVPDWAWVSVLTHAPAEQLVTYAARAHKKRTRTRMPLQWQGAVALLAQELLITAEITGCSVEDLQRSILLGMELQYSRPARGVTATDPSRMFKEVQRAFGRFRDGSPP